MGIEFQCDECGQLLNMDAEPGAEVTCPHCSAAVIVPAALASLPTPQVQGVQASPPPPQEQGSEGYDQDDYPEDEEELYEDEDAGALMTVMANSMPWVVSIFFHVGLGLIFILLVMIAGQAEEKKTKRTIPNALYSEDPRGAVSSGDSSSTDKATQTVREVQATGDSEREADISTEGDTGDPVELIGSSAAQGGGNLAQYGITKGGGGPRSGFGGLTGNAHHIVYLIDRSGSMFDTFDAVKAEIANSVGELIPEQDFHVILFADGDPLEKKPMALSPPKDEYKRALWRFLKDVKAENTTNPVKAINRAFDVLAKANKRPGKLIYMLTDGAFPDNDEVLSTIRSRNVNKEVLINTFLYGWKPPIAEKVMRAIASENGGTYRYVSLDE